MRDAVGHKCFLFVALGLECEQRTINLRQNLFTSGLWKPSLKCARRKLWALCTSLRWCCLMRILKSCTSVFRIGRNFRENRAVRVIKRRGDKSCERHLKETSVSQQGGWNARLTKKRSVRFSAKFDNGRMCAANHGVSKSCPFKTLC